MRAHWINPARTLLIAVLIAAAPAAQSVMYRWIDQNGALTYSDQPPSDPSTVKALTVIDGPAPPTSYERRAKEIIEAERDKHPGESTASGGQATQSEAAQDPCLRSADPKCHERNRSAYVPYLGYSPSAARVRSETPYGTGATGGNGASGAVGGSAGLPTSTVTPPRQPAMLQLRNSLKDAKDLK